jgi:hypothetical protein
MKMVKKPYQKPAVEKLDFQFVAPAGKKQH